MLMYLSVTKDRIHVYKEKSVGTEIKLTKLKRSGGGGLWLSQLSIRHQFLS